MKSWIFQRQKWSKCFLKVKSPIEYLWLTVTVISKVSQSLMLENLFNICMTLKIPCHSFSAFCWFYRILCQTDFNVLFCCLIEFFFTLLLSIFAVFFKNYCLKCLFYYYLKIHLLFLLFNFKFKCLRVVTNFKNISKVYETYQFIFMLNLCLKIILIFIIIFFLEI